MAKTKLAEPKTEKVSISDTGWTDYVLSNLLDDEKINGNPTTDGLRRIFETVLSCKIISSSSHVAQTPSPENEKRATVVHTITYRLDPTTPDTEGINIISVDGAADVYWGNCDKVYRNHPVAVAETRAEGRALRRALRLRKVVAAEEIAENIEDSPDGNSVNKISSNQINFIDVLSKRLDINVMSLIASLAIEHTGVYDITHEDAVKIIRELSRLQQDPSSILPTILGYDTSWK